MLFAQVNYRTHLPTTGEEVGGVVSAVVGRVTLEVGVGIESTLIDWQEFMTWQPVVVRALYHIVGTYL